MRIFAISGSGIASMSVRYVGYPCSRPSHVAADDGNKEFRTDNPGPLCIDVTLRLYSINRLGLSNKCAGIIPYLRVFSDDIYWRTCEYAAVQSKGCLSLQADMKDFLPGSVAPLKYTFPQVQITGNS